MAHLILQTIGTDDSSRSRGCRGVVLKDDFLLAINGQGAEDEVLRLDAGGLFFWIDNGTPCKKVQIIPSEGSLECVLGTRVLDHSAPGFGYELHYGSLGLTLRDSRFHTPVFLFDREQGLWQLNDRSGAPDSARLEIWLTDDSAFTFPAIAPGRRGRRSPLAGRLLAMGA